MHQHLSYDLVCMGQLLVIVLLLAALSAAAEPVVRSCAFEAHVANDGGKGSEIQFELVWDEEGLEAHMRSGGEAVNSRHAARGAVLSASQHFGACR